MGMTNEFERDLEDQAGLKRPGRIDLRVFQNTANAGDGHPGVQRCFRNYLHEGGMEKDIDLLGFGIKGTSVNINNAELQQLSNIGSAEISGAQWVFIGEADQAVKQADSPTFSGLTLSGLTVNGNIIVTGNVDSIDIATFKTLFDNHKANNGSDHSFINQDVRSSVSPTFVGLTLSADLVTNSTIDNVDIANHDHSGANQGGTVAHSSTSGRTANSHHNQSHVLSGGDHTASGLTAGYVIRATAATTFAWQQLGHGDLSGIGSNAHSVIDTHLGSSANPHSVTLDQAFDQGKIINGANSKINAFRVGDGTDYVQIWGVGGNAYIVSAYKKNLILKAEQILNSSQIRLDDGGGIYFNIDGTDEWYFSSSGNFLPNVGNTRDIGTTTKDVATLYYCNLSDTSCADFSEMSADELYQTFAQIKPRSDNLRHKTKDGDFRHIDFATLPDCFATKADEDFTKENMWKKENGELVKTTHSYKKGDNCGIEMGNMFYALKDLVVKSFEKIIKLEEEIELLKE